MYASRSEDCFEQWDILNLASVPRLRAAVFIILSWTEILRCFNSVPNPVNFLSPSPISYYVNIYNVSSFFSIKMFELYDESRSNKYRLCRSTFKFEAAFFVSETVKVFEKWKVFSTKLNIVVCSLKYDLVHKEYAVYFVF